MAYSNYLLFNNVFLKNLRPGEEELAAARYLVHESARDWYRSADLSSPGSIADTWIKPLLNQQSLDLVPCEGQSEVAWLIVAPWDRETPLAVCYVAPHGANLDGYTDDGRLPKGQHWMIRAADLARSLPENPLRWAVLTNGVQWRLLDAQALRHYEAYLEIDLFRLLNGEDDPLAAYLFYRLIRLEEAFEWDETVGRNRLDVFLEQSVGATEATESYLKTTVSDNLNTPGGGDGIMAQLCMGLVHAADPGGTRSFSDQERVGIYRDATYLLYRLLFILYAEARGLLPVDRPDYQAVSLNHLIDEATDLRRNPHKAARPASLWEQLTILFNAIHYSDEYLGIPPYNGGLFEDQDKPFLSQYAIENVYLAEALYELAFLPDPEGEEQPERIDYCDLSVRHLGSLYEGMIEYQLFIAEEELLARRDKKGQVRYLPAAQQARKPTDELVQPGKVYFAQSPHERKATGTHYTPEDLVARLVHQTVGRLLDARWQTFKSQLDEWLAEIQATPGEADRGRLRRFVDSQLETFVKEQVLSLRICDPTMGSGHFLVYIAHMLTHFIQHVLACTPWDNPAIDLDPDLWRRQVVEHCLYGVDINGMAVELAKLSLWLATMQLGRPLSFLDHHLKQGNSLLGVGLQEMMAVLAESDLNTQTRQTRAAEARGQMAFRELPQVQQKLAQANDLLDRIATRQVEGVADIEQQEADHAAIQVLLEPYRRIGDLLVARKMGWKVKEADLRALALALETNTGDRLSEKQRKALSQTETMLDDHNTFHWSLEFPQLFFRQGDNGEMQGALDVVIGNPPFLGGLKISGELGTGFLTYVKAAFAPTSGTSDLCSYFLRLGFSLTRLGRFLGMVATNTVAQGDTRETGLTEILAQGGKIVYADRYVEWGGDANVEVNLVGIQRDGISEGDDLISLDGANVPVISSYLDDLPEFHPQRLHINEGKAFIGEYVRGRGFVISPEEADELVLKSAKNSECIRPFLVGRDLNGHPNQQASRKVICFENWPREKAQAYPDLWKVLEERVKPERMKLRPTSSDYRKLRENWWQFARFGLEMRQATATLSRVIVRSAISELHMLCFVDEITNDVFSKQLVVFAFEDGFHFAILQSNIHEVWMRRFTSTMRTDINYSPSDCFLTFPFPYRTSLDIKHPAERVAREYNQHRQQVMANTQLGLTKTYNRFQDPNCTDDEIAHLRDLHAAMDRAVLACYGWDDIDLKHDFYPNDRLKVRYMPSREAQREMFTRLMALNQEIAAQEAAQGLASEQDSAEQDAKEQESDDDET